MYGKNIRLSAKRQYQTERSAKRDVRIIGSEVYHKENSSAK